MPKIVIGLVGSFAGGKGTIVKYILERYPHAAGYGFSETLREVLDILNVSKSRDNLQTASTVLRQTFGEDLLARAVFKKAINTEAPIFVVDGVRRFTDIEHLKDLPNFFLIGVDADPKIRYERMKLRNQNEGDNTKTFEQFMKDHNQESELQIPEVMRSATLTIINNGTLNELKTTVDEAILYFRTS